MAIRKEEAMTIVLFVLGIIAAAYIGWYWAWNKYK